MFETNMKHRIIRVLLTLCVCISACPEMAGQVVQDNFSDLDFTNGTLWQGDAEQFTVNAAQQLQLNDAIAGQSHLATGFTPVSLNGKEWRFRIKQTFSGSDNNQSRVYFAATGVAASYSGAGSAGVTGYFLKFGEGGSDDRIKLCRDNGSGNITELAQSTLAIANSFDLFIRVLRDDAGNFSLFTSADGTAFTPSATASDLTYITCSEWSLVCTYTVSNADNFFFDDFYFGDEILDETPPALLSANVTGPNNLDVLFSEPVDAATAGNNNFYTVAGIGTAQDAVPDDVNTALVHLVFSSAFVPNTSYSLEVSGVEDLSENPLAPGSTLSFIWFIPAEPIYRDVVFNEVLADPTPVAGLPEAEFVELFNASGNAFDLDGWQFVNSSTAKTLPAYTLAPGALVILCDDDFTGQFPAMIGIPGFSALTNSGDSLTLTDADGAVIDILTYDIGWYDTPDKAEGGWSLEQVNPFLPCVTTGNWAESTDAAGGTPGGVNSVFSDAPDATSPSVVSWSIAHPDTLHLVFSETMDTTGYSLPDWPLTPFNSITAAQWNSSLTEVRLVVEFPMLPTGAWQLEAGGITDCSGNELADVTLTFFAAFSPIPGDVIFNEIMPDPEPAILMPAAEYIELYNRSDHPIDLQGVSINDAIVEQQVIMPAGGYLVVGDADLPLAFLGIPNKHLLPDFPSLTNSGATLSLTNENGILLDEVTYDLTWYRDAAKDDGGWSLELINPEDPCSDAGNWRASEDERGGTAGELNSVYDNTPDTVAPQYLYLINEPQDAITLVFNEPLDESSLAGVSFTVNGELVANPDAQFYDGSGQRIILHYGEMEAGVVYEFQVLGLYDCWQNETGLITGVFMLPVQGEPGDVVINELLFDPLEGGYDFVELYNRSTRAQSLAGWSIANGEGGVPQTDDPITENEIVLLPGQFLVLTENSDALPDHYPFTRLDRVLLMPSMPAFTVGSGEVFLLMPDLQQGDFFPYNEDMHFDLLNSTDGVSLERVDPFRPSLDETNWQSAAQSQGFATPGYINSQSWFGDFDPEGISIEPEVFSPDNDGYQDQLHIHYADDTPGMLAQIFIFDSEGRKVRNLTRNELLGANNTISWDGLTDENLLAPVGIYVIYFEAISPDGRVVTYRKSCVLAHRI